MLDTAMTELRNAAAEKQSEIEAIEARLTDARSELRRINKAIATLDPTVGIAKREAAPVYADEVRVLLGDGPMTKAEISRRIGGHRTRATHAIKRLVEAGVIAPTGEERDRSAEYALV
jgi:DNA-binding MarR family transcriptional regulator